MRENPHQPKQAKSEAPDGRVEDREAIVRAQTLYAELQEVHNQEIDRATYNRIKSQSKELHDLLQNLSWFEKITNGLPWNPRDEVVAANDNRSSVSEAV